MGESRTDRLAGSLLRYAATFRVIGLLAAIGLVFLGIVAGNPAPSSGLFERNMGWQLTGPVVGYWVGAIVVLVQMFWCAAISTSVAALLVLSGPRGSSDV